MSVKCDQCGNQFVLPTENAGQSVHCPACDNPVKQLADEGAIRIKWGDIKTEKQSGVGALSLKKTESAKSKPEKAPSIKLQPKEEAKPKKDSDEGLIRLNCPACDQHLKVPKELGGHSVDCPSCQSKVLIPDDTQQETQSTELYIRFDCSGCSEPMAVSSEYAGQTIECPSCAMSSLVEAPSMPVAASTPGSDEYGGNDVAFPKSVPVPKLSSGKGLDRDIFWKLIGQAFVLKERNLANFGILMGISFVAAFGFIVLQFIFAWISLYLTFALFLDGLLLVSLSTMLFTYIKNVIRRSAKGVLDLPSVFDLSGDIKHYRHDASGEVMQTGEPPAFIKNLIHLLGIAWASYLLLIITLLFIYKGLLGWAFIFLAMFVSAFLFPVMLMGVSIMDSLLILVNVKLIFNAFKIFILQYLVIFSIFFTLNILFFLLFIGWAVISSFVLPLQFFLLILILPAFLYQALVVSRLLGFMYYANRDRLKWM